MKKINFQNATLKTQAHVIINGQTYNVVDSEYTGGTNLDANTLNQFQTNIENATKRIVATGTFKMVQTVGQLTKFQLGAITSTDENKLALTIDGGIICKGGVSKVLVSCNIGLSTNATTPKNVYIYINNNPVARAIMITGQNSIQPSLVISPKLVPIKENDVIYVYIEGEEETFNANSNISYITVEAF